MKVLLVISALVFCCMACTIDLEYGAREKNKSINEMDERKIYYSEVVAFGQVQRNVTGDYPLTSYDGIYAVEFQVFCTYKGGPIPDTIYIGGMGKTCSL